jgi:hypothetical protein
MKRHAAKITLNRESLLQLDPQALLGAAAGNPTAISGCLETYSCLHTACPACKG